MANVFFDNDNCGIKKKLIAPPKQPAKEFPNETKVTFHYVIRLCNDDKTILDDSRANNDIPMELIIGHKFKIEAWETCIKSMGVGEIASYVVDKSLLYSFPIAMKQLRDIRAKKETVASSHCCGGLKDITLDYVDLDKLLKNPEDLEFIFELLTYNEKDDYERETWTLNEKEKEDLIPHLKDTGNQFFKQGDNIEAAKKYEEALDILDNLVMREKPHDIEWIRLDNMKIPFYLNLAQCHLNLGNYYRTIDTATEVINRDPNNVKAYFRRAKGHVGAWNPDDAKRDFETVIRLDESMTKSVNSHLAKLVQMENEKLQEDKKKFQGKLIGLI